MQTPPTIESARYAECGLPFGRAGAHLGAVLAGLLAGAAWVGGTRAQAKEVSLAENGTAACAIVLPQGAQGPAADAAAELAEHLGLICGSKPEVAQAQDPQRAATERVRQGKIPIRLGEAADAPARAEFARRATVDGAFLLRIAPDGIDIVGTGDGVWLLNDTRRDADYHTGCSWDFPNIYTTEVRAKGRELLERAAKLAPREGLYAERVRIAAGGQEMLDDFCDMMNARTAGDLAAAGRALTKLDAVAEKLLSYDPPMIGARMYKPYMNRFFRPATEQGAARVANGNRLLAACGDVWRFKIDPEGVGIALNQQRRRSL